MSRVTVNVNGLSLVHEDSGGVSTATLPDVCLTPPTGAPVPYPNVARSRDLASGSSLVRADGGHRVAVAGSAFARSAGGEPGASGGVTSGVSSGEATFLTHSFDVTIEARGACRLTDKMLHNRGNTIDCSGVAQATVAEPSGDTSRLLDSLSRRKKKLPTPSASSKPVRGVDTNNDSLLPSYALGKRHRRFVGRYLIAFTDPEFASTDPRYGTSNGRNPGLTPTEVARLAAPVKDEKGVDVGSMSVFAIWEVSKYRAIESGTPEGQYQLGAHDAQIAQSQISWCGGDGKPIYFTVDFNVTQKNWNEGVMSWLPPRGKDHCPNIVSIYETTGTSGHTGDLIMHYFEGIRSVLTHPSRVGVYGTYYAVKKLFDHGDMIRYGWQQAFGSKSAKKGGKIDHRAQLLQTNVRDYIQTPGGLPLWGVQGGGALDYDVALADDFGQW